MEDFSCYAEELQDHSAFPRLIPSPSNLRNYTYCPWATSVVGTDPLSNKLVLIGVTCKRWGCHYCATRKVRRLAWMAKNAEPNRLMTLTMSSKEWESPKQCWEVTSVKVPELIRVIRKKRGSCEYLRVLELHESGYPHYHMMLRSPFIPQAEVLTDWRKLTGAAGVNLERIDSTFRTFRYLVKYLTKLHKIEWTDRHVSYSRDFFRKEDLEQVVYAKIDVHSKLKQHPWEVLAANYPIDEVVPLKDGLWELPYDLLDQPAFVSRSELGLPPAPAEAPPVPLKQRMVPGMEETSAEDHLANLRKE